MYSMTTALVFLFFLALRFLISCKNKRGVGSQVVVFQDNPLLDGLPDDNGEADERTLSISNFQSSKAPKSFKTSIFIEKMGSKKSSLDDLKIVCSICLLAKDLSCKPPKLNVDVQYRSFNEKNTQNLLENDNMSQLDTNKETIITTEQKNDEIVKKYSEKTDRPNIKVTFIEDTSKNDFKFHVTACGHIFHEKCLKIWERNHKTCPLCRAKINYQKNDEYFQS